MATPSSRLSELSIKTENVVLKKIYTYDWYQYSHQALGNKAKKLITQNVQLFLKENFDEHWQQ